MQLNAFNLTLFMAAAIAGALAVYVWRRHWEMHAGRNFFLLMCGIFLWTTTAAVESIVPSLFLKELVSGLSYLGIQSVPVFFFLLAMSYSGRDTGLSSRKVRLLFVVPLVVSALALTNPWHGWIWHDIRLIETRTMGTAALYERGVLFWPGAFYAYSMLGMGIAVLMQSYRQRPKLFRRQTFLLLLAALFPLAANAIYLMQTPAVRSGDFSPVFFTLSGLLAALALRRYRLLEVMPVPADVLVRHLSDGLVAIDVQHKIVGMNPAARELLGLDETAIGERVEHVFAPWPDLKDLCLKPAVRPIQREMSDGARQIEMRLVPLQGPDSLDASRLLLLRDVSERFRHLDSIAKAEALQRLLLELASDLIHIPVEHIDEAISRGVADVARVVGVDRAQIYAYDFEQRLINLTHDWFSPQYNSKRTGTDTPRPAFESLAEWIADHRRGRPVVIAAVDKLSSEDPAREILVAQGVQSLVAMPISYGSDCLGFAEFAIFSRAKRWMQEDLKLLNLIAQLIANAMARRQTEGKLRQLSQAIEQSPTTVVITDSKGHIEYVNPRFVKLTGYSREEVLGQNPRILKSGSHPPAFYEELWQTLCSGKEWRGEFHNRKKSGAFYWESAAISPVLDNEGRITHYVAVKEDITIEKSALENLEILSERLSTVIRHFPGGVLLENESRQIILANRAFCELFALKCEPEALAGTNSDENISESDLLDIEPHAEPFAGRSAAIVEQRKPVIREELRCRDGRTLERDYIPVMRGAVPVGHLWLYNDVTGRKDVERDRLVVERQLQQNQKRESLGMMAGAIAHDFNNLLMAIMGNIELAILDLPAQDPNAEGLKDAMQAARQAAGLTRQMLAYAGKGRHETAQVDLNALLAAMPDLIKTAVPQNIVLNMRLAPTLPEIRGDAGQIRQVVLNLVQNAAEAIDSNAGTITLETSVREYSGMDLRQNRMLDSPPPGRFVSLACIDNGSGMKRETLERIFDPFFTTRFTGRGLGMSAVHGIVKAHQGAIFIDSVPGTGSKITLLLPTVCAASKETPDHPDAMERPDARPADQPVHTVLVVEDDMLVRNVACKMVEMLGYRVLTANDGIEAIEHFRNPDIHIDCVLLDLSMPRMDGTTALPRLHRLRPDVPVLLCTGHDETDAASRVDAGFFCGIVHKPYKSKELLQALKNAMQA